VLVTHETLEDVLKERTREGELYEKLPNDWLRCYACGHLCRIPPGAVGVCKVRFNEGGVLKVPAGYVGGLQIDPIEKKPFFHVLPGAPVLSFGMLGCDLHCGFCQNWITSQALRDPAAFALPEKITAETVVRVAEEHRVPVIASTYNEPLITSEWAVEILRGAKAKGIRGAYVSNGNATPQVLDYLRPWVDFYKVDLKCFDDRNYRKLGAVLENVLRTIRMVKERGFWLEVVTLVIPGFNDSDQELDGLARFIASVSPDIPWHVTAFHQDYKMLGNANTPSDLLLRAARIGEEAGLHYVYAGNIPGAVRSYEDTHCPTCDATLIHRLGMRMLENRLRAGCCPTCGTAIPGVWS
jgi:pyruvate formate lyase activating enzyme